MSESDTLKTPLRVDPPLTLCHGCQPVCDIRDASGDVIAQFVKPEIAAALVNAVNGAGRIGDLLERSQDIALELEKERAVLEAGLRDARMTIVCAHGMLDVRGLATDGPFKEALVRIDALLEPKP